MTDSLKFVDLFSGLGGFHLALSSLGHECVFASEIDEDLRELYQRNFQMLPAANIRDVWPDIPPHDVLCAGFPCQPFSKAGAQLGFECPDSGDLFEYILKTIDGNQPKFLIFENVPNILRHASGETWKRILDSLGERGYEVDCREISPHEFGIPQIRPRAIIVGSISGLSNFSWPSIDFDDSELHLESVLEAEVTNSENLPASYIEYLNAWEEFLNAIPNDAKMPSFPIWAMEFGANYPTTGDTPHHLSEIELGKYRGAFGKSLSGLTKDDQMALLPSYARSNSQHFPRWKARFIEQNREFFQLHRHALKKWLPTIRDFAPSFQKLEWNWQAGSRTIWDKVIQFRASGIRVKNPSTAPSLVALTTSQVPVIAWQRRYMTMEECARLQSLDGLSSLPESKTRAFKAIGNAVNVQVVQAVARSLIQSSSTVPRSKQFCKAGASGEHSQEIGGRQDAA